jgi:hypothetical protein
MTADIKPWLFRPDGEVTERLEFLTDPLIHFDASEQRRDLREFPRRHFDFAIGISDNERRLAENLLFSGQAGEYYLPIWMDSETLTVALSPGASNIPADTLVRDYHIGGHVCLFISPLQYEILEIVGGSSTTIVVDSVAGTWPAGTTVMPIRIARLPDQVQVNRFTGGDLLARLRWSCTDDSAYTATSGTTYRNHDVLLQRPVWSADLRQDFVRKLSELDARVGGIFVDDESGGAVLLQSHRWTLIGRSEIAAFRGWLYARRGRLNAFWMPTFAQDLVVVADVAADATTIDVEHSGYAEHIAQSLGRRDIRIELYNGAVHYRRIMDSEEISTSVERLTISDPLGGATAAADIAVVSFMYPARLDSDGIELAWWKWDVVESSLLIRGTRDDI